MYLLVGLGNPGKQYAETRHNIGFIIIDKAISPNKARDSVFHRGSFKQIPKFKSQVSKNEIGGQTTLLAKPQTFMNNSGEAVLALKQFYKINPKNILVVHDDKDVPFGQIKIQIGRGDAGHNGVKSIIKHLGTKDFIRLRIGIKPNKPNKKETKKFVLEKFFPAEQKLLPEIINQVCEAVKIILEEGIEKAMTKYNQ